jgi:hypothetical protein
MAENKCVLCGELFYDKKTGAMFCCDKHKQKYYKAKYKKNESVLKKHTCICPMGHEWETIMFYTGRGKPRIYCPEHRRVLFGDNGNDYSLREGM